MSKKVLTYQLYFKWPKIVFSYYQTHPTVLKLPKHFVNFKNAL